MVLKQQHNIEIFDMQLQVVIVSSAEEMFKYYQKCSGYTAGVALYDAEYRTITIVIKANENLAAAVETMAHEATHFAAYVNELLALKVANEFETEYTAQIVDYATRKCFEAYELFQKKNVKIKSKKK